MSLSVNNVNLLTYNWEHYQFLWSATKHAKNQEKSKQWKYIYKYKQTPNNGFLVCRIVYLENYSWTTLQRFVRTNTYASVDSENCFVFTKSDRTFILGEIQNWIKFHWVWQIIGAWLIERQLDVVPHSWAVWIECFQSSYPEYHTATVELFWYGLALFSQELFSRRTRPASINLELPMSWLEDCLRNHGQSCSAGGGVGNTTYLDFPPRMRHPC